MSNAVYNTDPFAGAVGIDGTSYSGVKLSEFLDGWGHPIGFVRWAPAFLPPNSDVQTGDPVNDHDPFDQRRADYGATVVTDFTSVSGNTTKGAYRLVVSITLLQRSIAAEIQANRGATDKNLSGSIANPR